jgi:hypothetical protein
VPQNYQIRQGERCERVDEKYAARRALFKAACYSRSSRVFAEYFFSDMSHRPSKVNKAQKHCHGLPKAASQETKINKRKNAAHTLYH